MKILICLFVIVASLMGNLSAQNNAILTNEVIVKMVSAKLSDEIIMDEINNSQVYFNMYPDSIAYLKQMMVSEQVLQLMKITQDKQHPAIKEVEVSSNENKQTGSGNINVDTLQNNQPLRKANQESITISTVVSQRTSMPQNNITTNPKSSEIDANNELQNNIVTVQALSYTIPIEALIVFLDNEFNTMVSLINSYDKRVQDTLYKINQIRESIAQIQQNITDKKNADIKPYSAEIITKKKILTDKRLRYKQLKTNLFNDGQTIIKDLKTLSLSRKAAIASVFGEISGKVKGYDSDPSKGKTIKTIRFTKQNYQAKVVNYMSDLKEIPVFYGNVIDTLHQLIVRWSVKSEQQIINYNELNKQLEPLKAQLNELKKDSKKNKKEIQNIKKQSSAIEDQMEQVKDQMESDGKDLAAAIKYMSKEIQTNFVIRFNDIIENIRYNYQDKY